MSVIICQQTDKIHDGQRRKKDEKMKLTDSIFSLCSIDIIIILLLLVLLVNHVVKMGSLFSCKGCAVVFCLSIIKAKVILRGFL